MNTVKTSQHPGSLNGYNLTASKIGRLEKTLLLLWFVINLSIGALIVPDYGMSVDEPNNYDYAADTIDAYPSFFGLLYEPKYDSTYDGHGPAFVTIVSLLVRLIRSVFPDVFTPDIWHFSYFVTFQLGGLSLYWLTHRWFSKWTAWAVLVLFSTQPLLLGHAFINPKDIPFMSMFMVSVALGFHLVDSMETQETFVSLEKLLRILSNKFWETDVRPRGRFLLYLALALAIALALILLSGPIDSMIAQVISFFYTASPDSWAGQLFGAVASRASNVSAEDYVVKALRLFDRVERVILIAGVLFFLVYFGLLLGNTTLATFLRNLWKRLGESASRVATSLRNSSNLRSLKAGVAEIFRAFRNPWLILAGLVLGLATGVRAVAPWAGVIVFLYMFTKVRSRAWVTAIAYFLVAGIVTYIAWPRLWGAPITRYLEGLGVISNFPHYPGRVLFDGRLYNASELPRSYLPTLLNIQLTEPLLLGIYIGLALFVWRLLRNRLRTDLALYIGLGFAFPLSGLIMLNSPLYHNFRQALFVVPPIFIIAAFALELVFSKVTQSWARVLLIMVIALPGIYSSVKLHPYQYVYYNSLVGGPAGVANRYELDYWRISLREVALEMNKLAPHGAKIVVDRSSGLFDEYARPDFFVDKVINSTYDLDSGYDYIVQLTRWQAWELYPDVENIATVERYGAVLATVKALKNVGAK